jgi:hypothetical protein
MQRAPATYRVSAKSAADELDYADMADMVVLAETFVGWAIEEPGIAPHHRQRWATGWRQWRPAR